MTHLYAFAFVASLGLLAGSAAAVAGYPDLAQTIALAAAAAIGLACLTTRAHAA